MEKPHLHNNLLSVQDLSVAFSTDEGMVTAVDKVNFEIAPGKTLGLVGESGSGKSVTSMAIMRLLAQPPAHITGKILFEGQDLLALSEAHMRQIRGDKISMIFQEPMTSLNPVFTTGAQVAETLQLHRGLSKKDAWDKALELYQQVGIPKPKEKLSAYPHELSGGQKQRVMIAMAIACEPKLLICDEPTTALDVTIQKQVLELLKKLQQDYKMSMLFITHDLGVIADIADDVVVMYRSKIVEKNSTQAIFKDSKHPYTRGLMSCRPSLKGNPRRLLTVSDYMTEEGSAKEVSVERLKVFDKTSLGQGLSRDVLVEVNGLTTQFPIKGGLFGRTVDHFKAVDNVSLKIKKGQTLGLVGESGCGKTTLGRTMIRLIEPSQGAIKYNGQDITHLSKKELQLLRRKVQIIFQDPYSSLNPRMKVGDILSEPLLVHGLEKKQSACYDRAKYLMEKVGLRTAHIHRYPHEFSGGQRQRICIARALMLQPEFVICDESVSALDVSVQAQVLNLLLDLQDEFNLTYVFISHDLSVVSFIADEVGVMNAGKIVEFGKATDIYKNPQQEYTRTLLNAIPKGL
jgi:peptide/nickel transport system ATP-binding protein